MKKAALILVSVILLSLLVFSLCSAYYSNYAAPQLEFITNAFPGLWDKSKADVEWIMSLFPDYLCTDYGDQYVCTSRFNTNDQNNIFLNFFMDDYEEAHDNLWKVTVTADVQTAEEFQQLFFLLWIDGLKPMHEAEDTFDYKKVQLLSFYSEDTRMNAWFQVFDIDNNPFLVVEYYKR